MSGRDWNRNLCSLGAFAGCCVQCVGGSGEGTDGCVRETKVPSASSPPWQPVALDFWQGVEEGCCLEHVRRVADVPVLVLDLGTPLNITGRNKPH